MTTKGMIGALMAFAAQYGVHTDNLRVTPGKKKNGKRSHWVARKRFKHNKRRGL